VDLMQREGLPHVYARHALLAAAFHAFVHAVGCELAAKEPRYRSHTVSAMLLPPGVRSGDVVRHALEHGNVAIATGQDSLKDNAIRMGHMGPVQPAMLLRGVQALADALVAHGLQPALAQAGVDACARALADGRRVAQAA
jgi:alanine-glyoxylate transaminase/serine-glyoxylate transaminase/serine-pyruvate transaminase